MDSKKVDMIVQFALALSGEAEDFKDRELGPIHLLKFIYLADLAFSQDEGKTFTGADWTFHHFGPWAPEVFKRLSPAAQAIDAQERRFDSQYRDDNVRWRFSGSSSLVDQLEARLPWSVARTVRSAVRRYGNDTTSLLHDVYKTPPMLSAAPSERLVFERARLDPATVALEPVAPLPTLSKTKVKRLQELVRKRREERRGTSTLVTPEPTLLYDEVFARGQEWLDGLAGAAISTDRGHLVFSDEVWHSPGRREADLP
jgi:hypothetical protein